MKQIEIQKTSTAYILRFSRQVRVISLAVSGCLFLIGMTASLVPWLIYGATPPVGMIFISIYAGITAVGFPLLLVCRTMGFRFVADGEGFHRYSFNRVKRTFLWRHIRSCGIDEIPSTENEGRVMLPSFYVSTESPVMSMKNCLFIRIDKEGEQAVRESGMLHFCRRQLAEVDRDFK